MLTRKTWGLVALVGLVASVGATPARAQAPSKSKAEQQRFLALLNVRGSEAAKGTVSTRANTVRTREVLPGGLSGVEQFNRLLNRQGLRPPAIPPILLVNPRPANIESVVQFRQNYTLGLYRQRALRRGGGFAGGVFFTPPAGTPFYPVSGFNIFTYFPVYRAG